LILFIPNRFALTFILLCSYQSTDHTDFVCGLTWSGEDKLLTASYDGRILQHSLGKLQVNGSQMNGDISTDAPTEQSSSN
jgi:hypothetical protein